MNRTYHVSLIAIPDAVISTLSGIYDVMNSLPMVIGDQDADSFNVEIIGQTSAAVPLASNLSINVHREFNQITQTDIIIVPSVIVTGDHWEKDRYRELVAWIISMHNQGAVLCSACSGIFLLAETGLFDGMETTVHWSYANVFQKTFPDVPASPEKVLIAAGRHEELITSGASVSWHDMVLYLITRFLSPSAAHSISKFYALQWHQDGLAPYVIFSPPRAHGDMMVRKAQQWLDTYYTLANALEMMIEKSGIAERSFKRRFTRATGFTPINYIQRLRIEEAKRQLERTDKPIDEISWQVGYEDAAFFRKVFKRIVCITPAVYRKKFNLPQHSSFVLN